MPQTKPAMRLSCPASLRQAGSRAPTRRRRHRSAALVHCARHRWEVFAIRSTPYRHDAGVTPRLRIEPLAPCHAAALFEALDDARVYAYVPTPRAASAAELEAHIARLAKGAPVPDEELWLNWAVLLREQERVLGTVQATVLVGECAWIGYLLAPSAWGHGYAEEACRWLLDELASALRVNRVRASVDTRNAASIRLLDRLGFVHESTEPCTLHGEPSTDHIYCRVLNGGALSHA